MKATLQYAEDETPAEISSLSELDYWLERLSKTTSSSHPNIVTLHVYGYEISLGIGLPQSFVHVESESGDSPYLVTLGDRRNDTVVPFYLHARHHTEIPERNLIPASQAREILLHFFETGQRLSTVQWEEA
jgi:hypothetical protein